MLGSARYKILDREMETVSEIRESRELCPSFSILHYLDGVLNKLALHSTANNESINDLKRLANDILSIMLRSLENL